MPGIGIRKTSIGGSSRRWSAYWTTQDGEEFNNGKLVLSFDDGWESVHTNGLPLFREKGVPVTLFVAPAVMETTHENGFDFMSWAQIAEMNSAGMDIEDHSMQILTNLTDEQIVTEIEANEALFASHGITAKHFAYPSGAFDDRVANIIDNYKYTSRTVQLGYVSRKSQKYSLLGYSINDTDTLASYQAKMDAAKANKTALVLIGHMIGVENSLSVSVQRISDIIDYAKSIGLEITTIKQLYRRMLYVDLRLSRLGDDNQIDLDFKNNLAPNYRICVERSDDGGGTFTEIHVSEPNAKSYSDTGLTLNKNYVYRVRGYNGSNYLPYSKSVSGSTLLTFTVTASGNGTGVAKFRGQFSEMTTLKIVDGNAKFYTNAAGTLGESTEITTPIAAAPIDIYVKCSSGASNITMSKNAIQAWDAWDAVTNAPSIGGSVEPLVYLYRMMAGGLNTLSGDISKHILLNYLWAMGSNTLSGSINALILLTYLKVEGSNTLSGNPNNLPLLNYLGVRGSNTLTYPTVINLKYLDVLDITGVTLMTSANVNQLLADMWANRDEIRANNFRVIALLGLFGTGAPTGQGLIDKAALAAYRSPNMEADKALWTVTTRT